MKTITITARVEVADSVGLNSIEPSIRSAINSIAGMSVISMTGASGNVGAVSPRDTAMFLAVLKRAGGMASVATTLGLLLNDLGSVVPEDLQAQCTNTWYNRCRKMKAAGLLTGDRRGKPVRRRGDGGWENVTARPSEYVAITREGLTFLQHNECVLTDDFLDAVDGLDVGNLAEVVRNMGLLLQSAMDAPAREPRQPRAPRS